MLGQTILINQLNNQISDHKFARFIVLCGPRGSGKKTLCREISNAMACNTLFIPDVKVDTIRNTIEDAYRIKVKTLYIIPDADSMSLSAKNSLLKITEEPPNNAYFIMTLENINNSLPTIKSRAAVYDMQSYTASEILQYYGKDDHKEIISNLCETPGEVDYLSKIGPDIFYTFVKKVFNNIAAVSGANSFKIASKIALKENSEGYDLKLFLKAFKLICWHEYLRNKEDQYKEAMVITNDAMIKCTNKSINKTMLFDLWILSIRGVWL